MHIRRPLRFLACLALAMVGGLLASCSGDEPLTLSEYSSEGAALCGNYKVEREQLEEAFDALDLDARNERAAVQQFSTDAQRAGDDLIDGLLGLAPPASMVDDRQLLIDLIDDLQDAQEDLARSDGSFDELAKRGEAAEAQLVAMWPACDL